MGEAPRAGAKGKPETSVAGGSVYEVSPRGASQHTPLSGLPSSLHFHKPVLEEKPATWLLTPQWNDREKSAPTGAR